MYDIVIIGAGVSGCAVARELSRYQAKICVVERCGDVCCGTSKANSAIVHAGFDAPVGSFMAQMNVEGNERMEYLAKELDFPFQRNGSLVVCMCKEELPDLVRLYDRGQSNGVPDLKLLSRKEALSMEPNLSGDVEGALYAPTGGIVCPFGLTIALAENAFTNGVEFRFDTEIEDIRKKEDGYELQTKAGILRSRYVVNAAGVYADKLHNLVSEQRLTIHPRRGEYCLLDKEAGGHVSHTIFTLPGKMGKGVLVTPTVHGNLLIGPTAEEIEDREGTNTTRKGLSELQNRASVMVMDLPFRQLITSFAGLRAHEEGQEFVVGEPEDAKGFIDVAGIESPGLTSAPAIGVRVAEMLRGKMGLLEKGHFIATRKGLLNPALMGREERAELIRRQPSYGNVICRCETITEGEILDAIRRPLGARTLDGVKRRTRAGMGRCQAGFCTSKVLEILEKELQIDKRDITKSGGNSRVVLERR